jgi:hypothetical protein
VRALTHTQTLPPCLPGRVPQLVLYSDEPATYVDPIMNKLDPQRFVQYRLYRTDTQYNNGKHVRDLSKLNRDLTHVLMISAKPEVGPGGDGAVSGMGLGCAVEGRSRPCTVSTGHMRVERTPLRAHGCRSSLLPTLHARPSHRQAWAFQPDNAIKLKPWKGVPADTGLIDLIPFLQFLATRRVADVRSVVRAYDGVDDIPAAFKARLQGATAKAPAKRPTFLR